MGVQGFLPQLKSIQNPVSLNRYSGQTLAIDGYAWLHRASCSCAHDLVLGNPTDKYLQFFIKKLAMLKSYGIKPYFVFDGDSLPVKKDTEVKRRNKRVENREVAIRLYNSGEVRNSMDYFQKCVDVTPEMAKCVMDYCQIHHIDYIVAPFEADAQMVYLEKQNIVQGIISEDSDLLIFGCRRLITKLNDFGECIEICKDDFNKLPKKFPLHELSEEGIKTMVCLSGCDYTNGIPRIGLVKAIKLVHQYRNIDKILLSIRRDGKFQIPETFLQEYHKAVIAFEYQRVFCPISEKIVTLNDIPMEVIESMNKTYDNEQFFACIGLVIDKETSKKLCIIDEDKIDHEIHRKIAYGQLNPYNFEKRLVNRERYLQIASKSEIVGQGGILSAKNNSTKSIDLFFTKVASNKENSSVKRRPIVRSGGIVDKLTETIKKRKLCHSINSISSLSKSGDSTLTKSRFFSTNADIADTLEEIIDTQSSDTKVPKNFWL
ncbi:hypothetical protein Kpol_526p31 [Vanderwaltozyma polyspora DSM 70294]|uniref:Uncharacterized protein n=1 Tax=Vanderwaltozyma polyspora (strain ATCC 22028 / DSM 70294 / BCRC 21397 / CBS 2163 / NBRC 10782 / NRRL Y-8283 / UCD 57-17) TaxID=436907 RepID=A7TLT6_VANPO|nr:uncharacterized protein Kpol_526p31 [Vanderwaltozyma polyspora DSM 70294]EDO16778.1 hypothetical protein Kpol_526p31 [Vanderwaltozyma polyspora DSM 70294]